MVPRLLLKKWNATSINETREITESVLAFYAVTRAAWKDAEFKPTLEGIRAVLELVPSTGETLREAVGRLTNPELKRRVLWLLRFARYRAWNRSPIASLFQRAVAMAAVDGDQRFFKALGERLKDKPIPFEPPHETTALAKLLIDNWVVKDGLCLCWLA